uniref:Uncharacterized protein n=1 Tax=Thermococcus sp. AMT11 TaxID=563043 RepID=C8BNE4_9EURY|nr:unknown [Thermococcus sp. AMT11]
MQCSSRWGESMIEKIQVIIVKNEGATKVRNTYEVDKRKLSQKKLESISETILKTLGVKS